MCVCLLACAGQAACLLYDCSRSATGWHKDSFASLLQGHSSSQQSRPRSK